MNYIYLSSKKINNIVSISTYEYLMQVLFSQNWARVHIY